MQLAQQPPLPGEKPYESLSARAMEKLGRAADVPRDLQSHLFRFRARDAYQPRPLWEFSMTRCGSANYGDGAFFKDKIVIIGSSAQVAHDVFDTPLGPETAGPAVSPARPGCGHGSRFLV